MKLRFDLFARKVVGFLFGLVWPPVLLFRAMLGKEDPKRLQERWGASRLPRPSGRLVWIHGASVGECSLGLSLAAKLAEQQPDLWFLFTSGTRTSAQMMARQMGSRAMHQYLPMDTPRAATRFVRHWQPDLAIFLESEIWPNLLFASKSAGVPLALLNARMNQASRNRWQKFPNLFAPIIRQFDRVSAADEMTANFLGQFTKTKPDMPGNLKLLQPITDTPASAGQEFAQKAFARTPVWLAASTHAGEEQVVVQVHQKILEQYPKALLILVPRHPERGEKIQTLCQQAGLQTSRWTQNQQAKGSVLIADTIGEMPRWLALADVVLMGGSIGAGKGHNPLEAIRANKPVFSGTHVASFADLYAQLAMQNAVTLTDEPAKLADLILQCFEKPETYAKVSKTANTWVQAQGRKLERSVVQPVLALMKAGENESA